MPVSPTKRMVHNTLLNFAGRFRAMLLGLLLTPFLVAKLGVAGYAIWSLVLVITNYLFGMLLIIVPSVTTMASTA